MSVILDALKRVQDENRRHDAGSAAGVDVDTPPAAEPSNALLRRLAGPGPERREPSDSLPVSPVIWVSLAVIAVVSIVVLAMWLMQPEYAGPRVNDGRPLLADLTGQDAGGRGAAPPPPAGPSEDPGAGDAFAEGVRLQNAGDLAGAEQAYEQALTEEPDSAAAHNNLGVVLYRAGDYDAALLELDRALALVPDDALAHYNLGVLYERTGDIDSAIHHYHEFLSLGASRYPEIASSLDRHLTWLDGRSPADRDREPRR